MSIRLRQMCLVAGALQPVIDELAEVLGTRVCHGSGDLSRFGLPARGPMSDGGRKLLADKGVENVVLPLGRDFIEIVSPLRPDSSAHRYLQRRGGDGGYMVIFQTDELDALRQRCEAAGVRIVFAADFAYYRDVHLHTRDVQGAIVSFAMNRPDNRFDGAWYPAGTAWETWPPDDLVRGIAGAEIQGPEPEALAARWAQVTGTAVRRLGEGRFAIDIDGGELRFVPDTDGRGEGVGGLDLRVHRRDVIVERARRRGCIGADDCLHLAGMRLRLLP